MTINYTIFTDKIIHMIYGNNKDYNRDIFEEEGNKLGREIYTLSGYKGLLIVMNLVQQELLDGEYSNEYLSDLRTIELSFNGICDEWDM
jgi:hypothetical protein